MFEPLQLPLKLHPEWRGEWARAREAYRELLAEVAADAGVRWVSAGPHVFDEPDEHGGTRAFCVWGPRGRLIKRARGPAHPAPDSLSPGFWLYMENALRRCIHEWGCRVCRKKAYLGRSGICLDCRRKLGLQVVRPLHLQLELALGATISALPPTRGWTDPGRAA